MQCKEQSWKWEDGYEWEYPDGEASEGKKKQTRALLLAGHPGTSTYTHSF